MPSEIVAKAAAKLLADRKWTMAFAESATAGRAASEFALTEQSGKILRGALVCYDAQVKELVLGLSPELIKRYTPESAEVTRAAAAGLRDFLPADVIVATTGLTTPGGSETPDKPVGTMFIHIIYPGGHLDAREVFAGPAEYIILQTIDCIAERLITLLEKFH